MEGDLLFAGSEQSFLISIHSLRMEGDGICHAHRLFAAVFQSTPSVWRETQLGDQMSAYIAFQSTPSVWRETLLAVSIELISDISIHSLRMEGDPVDL